MSSLSQLDSTKAVLSFFDRSRRARSPKTSKPRRRRLSGLEVLQCEERVLMSGLAAPKGAHGAIELASHGGESTSHPLARHHRKLKGAPAPMPTLTPLQRLGYFNPATQEYQQLDTMPDYSSLLQGKDIYVLVHGWAPGYIDWVKAYAQQDHQVLEWWQTIPENYPGGTGNSTYQQIEALNTDGALPESPWLLDGYPNPYTKKLATVSETGLTQDLIKTDPNAVVLAYSWIDDSATSEKNITIPLTKTVLLSIPQDAYKSEAKTTVNGTRLAVGLEQAIGSPQDFTGKINLIGHSHGSKVATVAADLLTTAPTADRLPVNQLTILDSPESDSYGGSYLAEAGAANDNWYFLNDLTIAQKPVTGTASTFVDNYSSAFDETYDTVKYTKSGVASNTDLAQVIDTNLYAYPLIPVPFIRRGDPNNVHSYAAYWYAGSSESAVNYGNKVGRLWSPLVENSSPPAQSFNEQDWHSYDPEPSAQYYVTAASVNPLTIAPQFSTVKFTTQSKTKGAKVAYDPTYGSTVTLTQQNQSSNQTYTGSFSANLHYFSGLTFNYQFTNFQQGDELNIYTVTGGTRDLAFTMDPFLIQPQAQPGNKGYQPQQLIGTISLANTTLHPFTPHTLQFVISSTNPNSTSSMTVSNIMQFGYSALPGASPKPRRRR